MSDPPLENAGPLNFHAEELRRIGYQAVDAIVEHWTGLPDRTLSRAGDRAELESLLKEKAPRNPMPVDEVLDKVKTDILGHYLPVTHPRFFAFVPGPSNPVAALADALVSAYNPFVGSWLAAPGPAMCELVTIDWLRDICRLPESAGGLFLSGGSIANLTGLIIARHERMGDADAGGVAYCSDQVHSAIDRAARTLGVTLRKLQTDDQFRLPPDAVRTAVREDRENGLKPFCVIANAGTTNTGAVDPLPELRDICQGENLWFHVDGAYGAAAALCDEGRQALEGMQHADSLVLDPHKWLFQPFEIGCLLVRDESALERTFSVLPEYMKDVVADSGEVNFRDRSLQLTRSFRALKLWMTIKVFGLDALSDAVARAFHLARVAQGEIVSLADWEVLTPAQLGVITFRYAPESADNEAADLMNDRLVQMMLDDGHAFVTSTRLRGRTALRLCPINPRTSDDDIRSTIRRFNDFTKSLE